MEPTPSSLPIVRVELRPPKVTWLLDSSGRWDICQTCHNFCFQCPHFKRLCMCPDEHGLTYRLSLSCVFCMLYNNTSSTELFDGDESMDFRIEGKFVVQMGISHGYSEQITLRPFNNVYEPFLCTSYKDGFKLGEAMRTFKKWNAIVMRLGSYVSFHPASIIRQYIIASEDALCNFKTFYYDENKYTPSQLKTLTIM